MKRGALGLFNDKKSLLIVHEVLYLIFEIIVVIIVFLLTFSYVSDIVNNDFLEKNTLTRDSALIMDAVYAAPGDIVYCYDANFTDFGKKGYKLDIVQDKVVLYDANIKP